MTRIAYALSSVLLATTASAMVGGATPGNQEIASHVVAVVGERGTVCTGTAIARDLVLTAGHCVHPGDKFRVIELGTRRPQQTPVENFAQHPQYRFEYATSARPTADIAVPKLENP